MRQRIPTRTARRLLFDFEHTGLEEVARKRGRSPLVTLKAPAQSSLAQERKMTAQNERRGQLSDLEHRRRDRGFKRAQAASSRSIAVIAMNAYIDC